MKPRLRYSSAVDGWVITGFQTKGQPAVVPSRYGFNVLTPKVRVFFLTAIFFVTALSGGFAYEMYGKPGVFEDYLSYILPSLAAIFGGIGIYYDPQARKLFWFSALLLTGGIYFYFDVHSQVKVIFFLIFTAVVFLTSCLLFWVNIYINKYRDNRRQRIFGLIMSTVLLGGSFYLNYMVIRLLSESNQSPFQEKVLDGVNDSHDNKCCGAKDAKEDHRVNEPLFSC